ncbi:MAG: hypothetical protein K6G60_07450 [Lachnospiraceae bacterium]|nr:hypothetical protein [Lachnospiraceae bacterium]
MNDYKTEWNRAKDDLVNETEKLGFPGELGELMAKQLGSPKAISRMIGYLINVKPRSEELIVDEMLAICSDIERWREKKASEAANAHINEMMYEWEDDEE